MNTEGIVTYYTVEGGKNIKVVKDISDGKFYRVDTQNGKPLKTKGEVAAGKRTSRGKR